MNRLPSMLLLLVTAAISLPLVAGLLNRLHPALDSFAHFRLHLAALLVVAALLLLFFTRFRLEGVMALLLGLGAFLVTPGTSLNALLHTPEAAEAAPADAPVYRLLHLNARYDNSKPEEFLALVARIKPDVVAMAEVSTMWRAHLPPLKAAYPHQIICEGRSRVGGVAILSRRPFVTGSRPECDDGAAMAIARIDFGGQSVDIAEMHLGWPWPFPQAAQVGRLTPRLARLPAASILAGDFNATRWSVTAQRIRAAGKLREAGSIGGTWMPHIAPYAVRRLAGLGIDHVLAGAAIHVHRVAVLQDVGSDHFPVLLEFSLSPGEREVKRVLVLEDAASDANPPI